MKKILLAILSILQGLSISDTSHALSATEAKMIGDALAGSLNRDGIKLNLGSLSFDKNNLKTFFSEFEHALASGFKSIEKGFAEPLGKAYASVLRPILRQVIISAACLAAIGAGSLLIQKIGEKYIKKFFFEPSLIERKSTGNGFIKTVTSWFTAKNNVLDLKHHMIIDEKLESSLTSIMTMAAYTKNNGGQFENILLYGKPGTGKTLFAQLLAEHCGMDYAIIPGANVSQFLAKGEAVEKINELFAWAEKSSKGIIIFFDEAETFLADRKTLSNKAQNALNAFLAKTGTPSTNILIIAATNRPEILDSAVLSRFGSTIEFPLPDQKGRVAQLIMHIKNIFENQRSKSVDYTILQDTSYIDQLARRLDGCSGRTIQQLVNRILQYALAQNLLAINTSLVDEAIVRIKEKQALELQTASVSV
jgi:Holliday junction resolvasome RuvABC ATP-dependent DNA helicase subunit